MLFYIEKYINLASTIQQERRVLKGVYQKNKRMQILLFYTFREMEIVTEQARWINLSSPRNFCDFIYWRREGDSNSR